ncbi:MAG: ketopantoate reductase family protein [Microbacteriaceae bacterium]
MQSIRRGQRTEIDFLNGAVLRRGLLAGVPTPVSACIVALVHEVEDSGSFITPAAVAERAERYRE